MVLAIKHPLRLVDLPMLLLQQEKPLFPMDTSVYPSIYGLNNSKGQNIAVNPNPESSEDVQMQILQHIALFSIRLCRLIDPTSWSDFQSAERRSFSKLSSRALKTPKGYLMPTFQTLKDCGSTTVG